MPEIDAELHTLQNQPFAGDTAVAHRIGHLINAYGIKSIIETGTYHGATTRWLANRAPTISIESERANCLMAAANLHTVGSVQLVCGDSALAMPEMILRSQRPILFFLDAHWGKSWPLLAELAAIADAKADDSVIVIHDFKVPGTDLGFDSYEGQDLDLAYVRESMDRIYGSDRWIVSYNNSLTAGGLRRGVAYFTPKR